MADSGFTAAIIGLGQIGGSLGLALRRSGFFRRLVGFDVNAGRLRKARSFLEPAASAEEAVRWADVVVLAMPLGGILQFLEVTAPRFTGKLYTDVGSVKSPVVKAAGRHPGIRLVPGHPLAGNERPGDAGWDADLFAGKPYFLLNPLGGAEADLELVAAMVRSVGGVPQVVSAEEHDRRLALTSHLPLALAVLLMSLLDGSDLPEVRRFVGPGFRSGARLAGGSPEMGTDILLHNRGNLLPLLKEFRTALRELVAALESGDAAAVRELLQSSQRRYWELFGEEP